LSGPNDMKLDQLAYAPLTFAEGPGTSASPFVKFLFRRGELFAENARTIGAALKKVLKGGRGEDDFVVEVRKKIPAPQ
jgi:hypothetical protein